MRLSVEERDPLEALVAKGKAAAARNDPQAERLVLVGDNLNTHTSGALYEAFPAAEARRLWERLEFHNSPKHGSWLKMAETELSVLAGQCLDRRIDEVAVLRSEVGPWEDHRNRTEP